MLVRELRVTYRARSDLPSLDGRSPFNTPKDLAEFLRPLLEPEPVEVFGIVCLTTKHRVIAWHELSRGTLDATLVHPREAFKVALLANAAVVALAHNHPSGDPTPSADDVTLTARLVAAGALLGVDVIDHIIIGHDSAYYSFKEAGKLS